jgi:membrane protein
MEKGWVFAEGTRVPDAGISRAGHDAAVAQNVPPADARRARRPHRRQTFRRWMHRLRRRWRETKALMRIVGHELLRTKVIDSASGLAFWFMLSMVPLLMAVIALVSFLPIPGLIPQLMTEVAILVPANSLAMVENLLGRVLQPHTGMLSFGILSYLWSSTGGFTSVISALNIAYDVKVERSWLQDRIRAIILTFTSGLLLTISLLAIVAGPHFASIIGQMVTVPAFLEKMWPVIRIGTVFVTFALGLEIVYFLAPNRRQKFASTIPGSIVAIVLWFGGSWALSFYLHHSADFSRLYGGLGAVFGLMFWIYLTALAILIGGEANAELAKRRDALFRGHLKQTVADMERLAMESSKQKCSHRSAA